MLLYIKRGLKAYLRAFSPIIIIEDQYLQTFIHILKENDILFSIAGTLGRVTSVKSSILPANTNQALAIIRLKSGCLKYVKTYLKGKAVADFIKKNPTIGAQPNLSLEQVSNLEIALPSDIEQEQIGSFFENLDNLITLHQRECFLSI